ncbi:MAG: Uncharacterised protein [Flavobacterium sp. SCGC AAA160-P02]|nr:MAG: Uncharacterised protein [Flavobacterium sp. SCGC AAA160-P02]
MIKFIREILNHFFNSNTFQKGAALAYYAVFSLLPIIVIATSLLGIFFGKQAISGDIYNQLKDVLGNDASIQIQNIIKNQHTNHNSVLTSVIGFVTLGFSASGMFNQIHNSFNDVWNIKAKPKNTIINYFSKHLVSFFLIIVLFFIVSISTALNYFVLKNSESLHIDYKFIYIYEHIISFVLLCIIFSLMFKFLGDAKIHLRAVIYGAIFTALLFILGKIVIGIYIKHSHVSSTFGSASLLALLMLWIYYTSQIIFLGASFVTIISSRLGYKIQPKNGAVEIKNMEIHK